MGKGNAIHSEGGGHADNKDSKTSITQILTLSFL